MKDMVLMVSEIRRPLFASCLSNGVLPRHGYWWRFVAVPETSAAHFSFTPLTFTPWPRDDRCTTRTRDFGRPFAGTTVHVCLYRVKTVTSKVNYAGTDALVEIQLHGSAATCSWKELDVPGDDNERGKTSYFNIWCPCLGYQRKLRIRHDNTGKHPGWHLKYVGVKQISPNQPYYHTYYCNKWLSIDTQLSRWLNYPRELFV
ncbi:hypothetical protein LSAT2_023496, partial [Lamellibrachia satsuma]